MEQERGPSATVVAWLARVSRWVRDRRPPPAPAFPAPDRAALFRTVADLTPKVFSGADPRGEVCAAALVVTGADGAWLLESDAAGVLATTACARDDVLAPAFPASALRHGGPVDATLATAKERGLVRAGPGVRALHLTPVHDKDRVTAVLAVGWGWDRLPLPESVAGALTVLAAQAAVALDRADTMRALRAQARRDVLTGLPNRRAWDERLDEERARAWREGKPLTIALLDLDHFKRLNDRQGHQAGDAVLKEAAAAWRHVLRVTDLLTRWGGEEFALLLPGCGAAEALPLLERVRALTPRGQTCSAGVAEWDGREDAEGLIARADAALYLAKRGGRDRTVDAVTLGDLDVRTVVLDDRVRA